MQCGFIAQEVESAAKSVGFDFHGVDKPKNDNNHYGLRYAEFVVPLVKAVQELEEQNKDLMARIESLEAIMNQSGQKDDSQNESNQSRTSEQELMLFQNRPNPATESTIIEFYIPSSFQNVILQVVDLNGKVVFEHSISSRASGVLSIEKGLLPKGTYRYSLITDGSRSESKTMIIL